ncbi:sulfite exporter TauE/SafE family protein [Dysgonomonas sp. 216]|uniref:sulfite exporter TauE/SafE family protein n=1 Tax=Dysgonomonas sp. 216 TaxID=2302934 RepID=UPI0013D4A322|nr:sulfite exporter TauE/SafE family protein [Dysgonomonas sp. 216]NDW19592.1 sulfite exporter TauE/SafE family protein [Dysgonomonas sp. 216]
MDFSIWMLSPSDWLIFFMAALFIGMSKTGIQGVSLLSIPLMAMIFGAKPSTGIMLPILCFADLMAVLYYRRIAEWKYIFKLLPSALIGVSIALLVDKVIPPEEFKQLMGICLLVVFLFMLWAELKGKENNISAHWWYAPSFGILGGFTTMIGNAAGPVLAIYLLSMKLPKYSFVGTNAWFFLVINYLKMPVQVIVWNNINTSSLILGSLAIPFVVVGGISGIKLVKKLPEKGFRYFTIIMTFVSVLLLII